MTEYPRTTRRQFLHTSAAGAGALLLHASPPFAAEERKPDFTFALVSDTHLGRGGEAASKAMKIAVAEVNESAADFTIFCGDLVNNGERAENERRYTEWVEIARGLKKDYFAVPGNHDPDALFLKHVRPQTDFVLEHKGYRFVCFRDAEVNPGHDGIVTPEQMKWLHERVQEAARKEQRVVLVAHVIYHQNQHPDVGWYIKKGRDEFGKLLKDSRHIGAFFAGHFHCGMRGWDDTRGIHEVILPSTAWNNNRGLDKAPGFSLNDFRTGYGLVEVHGDRMVLTYKPLGAKPTASRELRLS